MMEFLNSPHGRLLICFVVALTIIAFALWLRFDKSDRLSIDDEFFGDETVPPPQVDEDSETEWYAPVSYWNDQAVAEDEFTRHAFDNPPEDKPNA